MKGTLLGAFCERGNGLATRCLELWAYPDTTLNLVVNRFDGREEYEYAFPCAPHQLVNVLQNRSFETETSEGKVVLERENDLVKAGFQSTDGEAWEHSVEVEPFVNALAQVAPEAEDFVKTE